MNANGMEKSLSPAAVALRTHTRGQRSRPAYAAERIVRRVSLKQQKRVLLLFSRLARVRTTRECVNEGARERE